MSRKTITTTKTIKVLKAHLVFASQVGFFIALKLVDTPNTIWLTLLGVRTNLI